KANAAYASLPSIIKLSKNRGFKTSQAVTKTQQKQPTRRTIKLGHLDQFSGIKVTKPCRQRRCRRR
ncbi:hypothetical protein V1T76_14880, partial [Roseibium sp. FZY0029]|uniref:hypothetical protein n=1 Tax=Roseibium sp. FZY0029 TaxID=3116647 RepID=UPI002EBFCBEA|nr:hypothetical protein [Roseibium sp. FZY0029]